MNVSPDISHDQPKAGLDHLAGFVFILGIVMTEPAQRPHFLLQ